MEATRYQRLIRIMEQQANETYIGKRTPEPGDPQVGLHPEHVEELEAAAFMNGVLHTLDHVHDPDETGEYEWQGVQQTITLQCQAQGCHDMQIIPIDRTILTDHDLKRLAENHGWQIGDKGVQRGKTYCPRHYREANQ